MGLFFTYILKSTICLAMFYLFYRLLLNKETFHRFNRIVLLSLIFLSVIIPVIRLSIDKENIIQSPMLNLEQLLLVSEQSPVESIQSVGLQIILLLYIAGVVFFLFRLIYSTFIIIKIIRSGEVIKTDKSVKIIMTDLSVSPFSWLKYIVISRSDWEESNQEIVEHEMAHIRNCHSWDVLASGLCVVFHWFNPAAWLLKQELQNLHEYEADESVINQGIDAKRYQLLLIKKAVGAQRFTSMANSFNHSKLKKRITMMLKSKSNSRARLKYLFVLPMTAIAIAAFARPEISRELDKISSTKISELPLIEEVLSHKIKIPFDTLVVVDKNLEKNIQEQVKPTKEINLKEELKLYNKDLYILIDDIEATQKDMDNLDPMTIESISVLKTKEKIKEKYGKDVEGVIIIKTKKDI